ncbi:hypothetical protein EDD11_004211 [Mortierella claussenii]|nr:hypothetical protein EDD11_004211 [Mortierella claussenii]
MIAALSANRRAVKAFEAFYFLSLVTQFAFVVWALIWCKSNQSNFDTVCNASKGGQVELPIPGFASSWTCDRIFMVGMLTLGVGTIVWVIFNVYMTNRVIHYARELFEEKANRYKVLGEAATKELDREQQIPLNYTNVGKDQDENHSSDLGQQPSYRDEIEYKDPRGADAYQHSRAAAAGFGAYGHDLPMHHQHQHQQHYQHPVAPGFDHRGSVQGLDLMNPYYGEPETIPAPIHTEPVPASAPAQHAPATAPFLAQGTGQSFVHTSTNKIASPFDADDDTAEPVSHSPLEGIKVPLPPSPRDNDIKSPTVPQTTAVDPLSPTSPTHKVPVESHGSDTSKTGEPYPF